FGRLVTPPRMLTVGFDSRMPAVIAPDGSNVGAAALTLVNSDPDGAGDILLGNLRLRAAGPALEPLAIGTVAERVEAWVDGAAWAVSASLAPDSTTALLVPPQPL